MSDAGQRGEWFGLPSGAQLEKYRIWDSYFTPSHSNPGAGGERLMRDVERSMPAILKGKMERLCLFPHVGLGTTVVAVEEALRKDPDQILKPFERWPELLLGLIQVNPHRRRDSRDAINRWVRDGPMVGVYFPGSGNAAMPCNQREMDPLVEQLSSLQAVIMQHTWFKTGGKGSAGESTPSELAELALRFPEQPFIAAHAGGEWEKGIRAVRSCPNVLVETSGFDATAGFLEMAVRDLGAGRIVFGSHLPSRSLGTELGKVLGADLSERDRHLILGANFRDLLRAQLPGDF